MQPPARPAPAGRPLQSQRPRARPGRPARHSPAAIVRVLVLVRGAIFPIYPMYGTVTKKYSYIRSVYGTGYSYQGAPTRKSYVRVRVPYLDDVRVRVLQYITNSFVLAFAWPFPSHGDTYSPRIFLKDNTELLRFISETIEKTRNQKKMSPFRGLPQDMVISSRCVRRDFPKKVKSIFSFGIARSLENKLRMNYDALVEFRETPDYHKNCFPWRTSDSYSYTFCRSKLILLLICC